MMWVHLTLDSSCCTSTCISLQSRIASARKQYVLPLASSITAHVLQTSINSNIGLFNQVQVRQSTIVDTYKNYQELVRHMKNYQ